MQEILDGLLRHGYLLLFAWVFLEQIGVPLPALPLLVAAGALAREGQLSFGWSLAAAVAASIPADALWYGLGRIKGVRILRLLCRLSLEPDSCVRETTELFGRQGARTILVAKFVPGVSTAAPALAGVFGMRVLAFLLLDTAGCLVWAGSLMTLGLVFHRQIDRIAAGVARLGGWSLVVLIGGIALYVAWKFERRRRFIRRLAMARLTPEELMARLDAGEDVVIVDLRHDREFEAGGGTTLPRALRFSPDELERIDAELPRDREIVLFCT